MPNLWQFFLDMIKGIIKERLIFKNKKMYMKNFNIICQKYYQNQIIQVVRNKGY